MVELTVADTLAGFASGQFTSEQLTLAFQQRIERYNPAYNAIVFHNPAALEDARAIDRRRAAGEALPPLAGVPVVVKDAMDMVGFPTTGGWSLLHSQTGGVDLMPATDAPVVARMRAAGAVSYPAAAAPAPRPPSPPAWPCSGWRRKPAGRSKTRPPHRRWWA